MAAGPTVVRGALQTLLARSGLAAYTKLRHSYVKLAIKLLLLSGKLCIWLEQEQQKRAVFKLAGVALVISPRARRAAVAGALVLVRSA